MSFEEKERRLSERIKAHVRQRMVEKKVGQAAMADKLNTLPGTFHKLLNDRPEIVPLGFAIRVHDSLGIPWTDLIERDPDERFFSNDCLEEFRWTRSKSKKAESPQNPSPASESPQPRKQGSARGR